MDIRFGVFGVFIARVMGRWVLGLGRVVKFLRDYRCVIGVE